MPVTFVIVDGNYPCLLGRNVSEALGLVIFPKQSEFVYAISEGLSEILIEYDGLFQGLGKLKDFKAKISVDPSFKPVVQPIRRSPYHVRSKIEQEVERLKALDIIEEVNGPTPWLVPAIAVPKKDNSVRLCLDERIQNQAVIDQKFPIPLTDEVLQKLEDATVITELDFNQGYHQIELDEESRNLTAFATDTGTFRFKRLIFGLKVSSEIFQYAISQVLKGCEGVGNISDNTVVYGKTQQEHDRNLRAVFDKLKSVNLTLNKQKCKFGVDKLTFMGHVVSKNGTKNGTELELNSELIKLRLLLKPDLPSQSLN